MHATEWVEQYVILRLHSDNNTKKCSARANSVRGKWSFAYRILGGICLNSQSWYWEANRLWLNILIDTYPNSQVRISMCVCVCVCVCEWEREREREREREYMCDVCIYVCKTCKQYKIWILIGEGNGNPLQCSCLENPRDGGAWWAAVYGVAQSWTRLKRLSR